MTPVAREPSPALSSPDLSALAERAAALRRSTLQTRLRLAAQSEALDLLALRLASVRKEAAAVSAPVAVSLRKDAVPVLRAVLPFLAIGAAAWFAHVQVAGRLAFPAAEAPAPASARPIQPPPVAVELDPEADALVLVQEWRPDREGPSLLELLGGELDRPGLPPAWSVERSGPRHFIVRFRDGSVEHAFEADLDARFVRPAADVEPLLSAR